MSLKQLQLVIPVLGLAALLAAAMLFKYNVNIYQSILKAYGADPFQYPFFDLEYVVTVTDCWKKGVNVYLENPCDLHNRPHDYSPLWLRAKFIPVGYQWTVVMGSALDSMFFISLYWIVRPVTGLETVFSALCCFSTMTVFALERGNVDVLFFLALAAAAVLAAGSPRRRAVSYGIVFFAGLLKFYPLATMALAIRERPRRFLIIAVLASIGLAVFVVAFRDELALMQANIPRGSFISDRFGAINLVEGITRILVKQLPQGPSTLALTKAAVFVGLLVITVLVAFCWTRLSGLQSAYNQLSDRTTMLMLAGVTLIAGCFFAGQSTGYRGIHLVFVAAGLIELRRQTTTPATKGLLAAIGVSIVLLMWEDFFRTNLGTSTMDPQAFRIFWLFREVLWWNLVAFLLATMMMFGQQTELVAHARSLALRRRAPVKGSP